MGKGSDYSRRLNIDPDWRTGQKCVQGFATPWPFREGARGPPSIKHARTLSRCMPRQQLLQDLRALAFATSPPLESQVLPMTRTFQHLHLRGSCGTFFIMPTSAPWISFCQKKVSHSPIWVGHEAGRARGETGPTARHPMQSQPEVAQTYKRLNPPSPETCATCLMFLCGTEQPSSKDAPARLPNISERTDEIIHHPEEKIHYPQRL